MAGPVAFVLGGGGLLGAHEVGMLRALLEAGIVPDLVVGTSVGAINGVVVAEDPTTGAVQRLAELWLGLGLHRPVRRVGVRPAVHAGPDPHVPAHRSAAARRADLAPAARTFEELHVPFQCVAANVERAAEHWFSRGPLVEAVLASCAVPGLLPPVQVDGQTYLDGGLVHSIPVGRAVALGATHALRPAGRPDRAAARARRSGRGRSGWSRSRWSGGTGSPPTWPRCRPG